MFYGMLVKVADLGVPRKEKFRDISKDNTINKLGEDLGFYRPDNFLCEWKDKFTRDTTGIIAKPKMLANSSSQGILVRDIEK